jgi:hypothetical protein
MFLPEALSGFGFQTAESPALIDGNSPSFPGTPTMTSVAYENGLFSDAGTTFVFTPTAVPEPTSLALVTPVVLMLFRRSNGRFDRQSSSTCRRIRSSPDAMHLID